MKPIFTHQELAAAFGEVADICPYCKESEISNNRCTRCGKELRQGIDDWGHKVWGYTYEKEKKS